MLERSRRHRSDVEEGIEVRTDLEHHADGDRRQRHEAEEQSFVLTHGLHERTSAVVDGERRDLLAARDLHGK